MPVNKTALIRYKTIDQCIRNTSRSWTLEDLIQACSEAIFQIEGNSKGASKRTVQADLQLMRDAKKGYGAPIVVHKKKYYGYAQEGYSILNEAISKQDLEMLQEANDFLDQLQHFKHFEPLESAYQEIQQFIAQKRAELNKSESPLPTGTDQIENNQSSINNDLQQKGFAVSKAIYSDVETQKIIHLLKQKLHFEEVKETGLPLLLSHAPALKDVLLNETLNQLLKNVGLAQTQLVNAIFYPKSPQTSFYTNPHQTITITVKERHQVEGFSGWSTRGGITSVMAPAHILQNMFSVKICLKDSNQQNGGLQIIPGSHKKILTIHERNFLIANTLPININANKGDCLVLKPLILKAYQKNITNLNAPVIQLDFCTANLPHPLSWHIM